MLATCATGIESIQDRADLIVSGLQGDVAIGAAGAEEIRPEYSRIGRGFSDDVSPGREGLPPGKAPACVRGDRVAVDQNIEVQGHRVDDQEV